jgi:MoxR-like ATPase
MPFAPIPVTTEDFVAYLTEQFGTEVNTKELFQASEHFNCSLATVKKRLKKYKQGIGKWNLTIQEKLEIVYNAPSASPAVAENLVPDKDHIRVNITIETDEDDLIGGFRLVNGETVWHNGPVIEALERGAILLLDEVDLASNKILCLQSVLEGKGLFLKKTGRYVERRPGFNIFATANTKGKGSEDGRFIGTNVLNEAFLERFALTFEQDYPTPATETKILEKAAASLGVLDKEFCEHLANWADIIRRTFNDGGVDEVISTRRLVHIIRAFAIWQNRMKAIKVCTNRFDDETKQSFLELYDKIDADVVPNEVEDEATV